MENVIFESMNEQYRVRVLQDVNAGNPREFENLGTMICWHPRYKLGDEHNYKTERDFFDHLAEEHDAENTLRGLERKVVILPLYLYDHSGLVMKTSPFSDPWDSGRVGWIYCPKERFINETGYLESELFSSKTNRKPIFGEHVRLRGHEGKGPGGEGFGKIVAIDDEEIVVDFDYHKIPAARDSKNLVSARYEDVVEVLSGVAEKMLNNEVTVYNDYLSGNVYGFVLERVIRCDCCGHLKFERISECFGFYGDAAKAELVESLRDHSDLIADWV